MIIRPAKPTEKADHHIYVISDAKELVKLSLTGDEKSYVSASLSKKEDKIIRLNRYPKFVYIVYIATAKKKEPQLLETTRINGNKLLRMLKAEDPAKVVVQSLNYKLNAGAFAEGMALGAYQFLKYYSDKAKRRVKLSEICIEGLDKNVGQELSAIIKGVYKARDLVNEPLSFLTANQLAQEAKKAGDESGFKVEILNKKKIESLKMGGLLAVNKGSIDPPTFSVLEYCPNEVTNTKPIILVGKGVVYDTGGLSLKPTPGSMDSMKSDMGGSAAVIGTMIAAAEGRLPLHIVGLVPATDNRPGKNAYVPGDVIEMYDGSTVEVLNTDAEGRMLLADALAYAKKYKPEMVIDLATLTGAAAVAIGKFGVVAMGTAPDKQFQKLTKAGDDAYERIARFPFWDEYNSLLKSSVADVKNIGGREGGAITAGKFLERFTDYPWIHLDIAGPAFLNADDQYRLQGGTGVGVRLLFNYLKNYK
jgi:leucyl aminopeptidase